MDSDIIITENVVHKRSDSLRVFAFPPRGVSLNQEKYDWLNMLMEKGVLKSDSILVDEIPMPIKTEAPKYPDVARKYGQEGFVYLIAWINTNGTVRKAAVVAASDNIFIKPTFDVVMNWIFTPALTRGKPTEVSIIIPFKFKLNHFQ